MCMHACVCMHVHAYACLQMHLCVLYVGAFVWGMCMCVCGCVCVYMSTRGSQKSKLVVCPQELFALFLNIGSLIRVKLTK